MFVAVTRVKQFKFQFQVDEIRYEFRITNLAVTLSDKVAAANNNFCLLLMGNERLPVLARIPNQPTTGRRPWVPARDRRQ